MTWSVSCMICAEGSLFMPTRGIDSMAARIAEMVVDNSCTSAPRLSADRASSPAGNRTDRLDHTFVDNTSVVPQNLVVVEGTGPQLDTGLDIAGKARDSPDILACWVSYRISAR